MSTMCKLLNGVLNCSFVNYIPFKFTKICVYPLSVGKPQDKLRESIVWLSLSMFVTVLGTGKVAVTK